MVNLNQNKTYLKGIFNSLICEFIFDLNQECKHINALADSSLSKVRLFVMTKDAFENKRSIEIEVSVMLVSPVVRGCFR